VTGFNALKRRRRFLGLVRDNWVYAFVICDKGNKGVKVLII
jgi:hypothetical protein